MPILEQRWREYPCHGVFERRCAACGTAMIWRGNGQQNSVGSQHGNLAENVSEAPGWALLGMSDFETR